MSGGRKQVEIYTSPFCGYCMMARQILQSKNVPFVEIGVMGDPAARAAMIERAGGRHTVPQIFIGGVHVGGAEDLRALDRGGRLDAMLAA